MLQFASACVPLGSASVSCPLAAQSLSDVQQSDCACSGSAQASCCLWVLLLRNHPVGNLSTPSAFCLNTSMERLPLHYRCPHASCRDPRCPLSFLKVLGQQLDDPVAGLFMKCCLI